VSSYGGDSAYALLVDGTTVEIRQVAPGDFDAVRDMHEKSFVPWGDAATA
jgi:hypothetical protein